MGDVPGGRRDRRRLLFRNDAGARHHAGRSGPGGGRCWALPSGPLAWSYGRRHAAPAYHVPWLQAALALTGAAMVAASWHLVFAGVGSWTGAGAFVVIAVLAFLLNRERPRAIWAHLSLC